MNVISQDAMAKIAINKSLLKEYTTSEYARVVYLNDNDEFQIQLFNPKTYVIAAKINLDGEDLNDMLVIRPGERIWLERYLDKAKKFKFSTYDVDDSPEATHAIAYNGRIVVSFFKVKTDKRNPIVFINNSSDYIKYYDAPSYYTSVSVSSAPSTVYYSAATNNSSNATFSCNCTLDSVNTAATTINCSDDIEMCASSIETLSPSSIETIETGRIEEGGYSNQKFSYVDYDFESYPFVTETIKILPLSRKPHTSKDLQKRYCGNCGRKISPKHKFCPYCGTKVD